MQQKGVRILLPQGYSYKEDVNGLRLGYAYLSEEQLNEGIRVLASLL